jgi:hypothetical protein
MLIMHGSHARARPSVGLDQPGIAARIAYHGVGKSVPVASMNKEDLSGAIQNALGDPSYKGDGAPVPENDCPDPWAGSGGRCARTSISRGDESG